MNGFSRLKIECNTSKEGNTTIYNDMDTLDDMLEKEIETSTWVRINETRRDDHVWKRYGRHGQRERVFLPSRAVGTVELHDARTAVEQILLAR